MAFDASKLPREQLLAEAFPGQLIKPNRGGWARLSCTHPACTHPHGDRPPDGSPSLDVHVESGAFVCRSFDREGRGWRDFVCAWWDEERWRQLCREYMQPSILERWEALDPERAWTRRYRITPDLSRRYLRSGVRYPGDPRSDSVVGLWDGATLRGIKWRRPDGATWPRLKDHKAKYALTKGSTVKLLLLGDRLERYPDAELVVCAGEKDALVAASHLDPTLWAPVSGCYGEAKAPYGLREAAEGRRVVVAYDGDAAGREGAQAVVRVVGRMAASVRVASLPEDTPPGASKPGWDLADVLLHQGPGQLAELLRAAVAPPDGCGPAQAEGPSSGQPTPDGWRPDQPLDSWELVHGWLIRWVGSGDRARQVSMFRGVPEVLHVRQILTEDQGQPGEWLSEETVTYRFRLVGGPTITRCASPDRDEFFRVLRSSVDLSAATHASHHGDLVQLHRWALERSPDRTRAVELCGVGPHDLSTLEGEDDDGWIAAPDVIVRGGRVERLEVEVGQPSNAPEFSRYRLSVLEDEEFRRAARWIAGTLLRCDHAGMAYTLPLLGAFLSPPLWEYLGIHCWQRAAFFVRGESGVGKTQICRYFWSFWGDFVSGSGLTTWISTPTYMESLLHHAVQVPVFVSDWKRQNFPDSASYRSGMNMIQSYADRSSRGRAQRGTSLAERKNPPRCTWILDGEDLPEGEQSTLGRLVVLEVAPHGPTRRCASASAETLDDAMVSLLPGVTARWIAWVQRHRDRLRVELTQTHDWLDGEMLPGCTNRSRLVRAYAVHVLATVSFLGFLAEEAGLVGLESYTDKARARHVQMANAQLAAVSDEAASEQFLRGLVALLQSGGAHLRPRHRWSGDDPFGGVAGPSAPCIGSYDSDGLASVWPDAALPTVNRYLSQGGGGRIEHSRGAIEEQLLSAGAITKHRPRVGGRRIYVWCIPLSELGVDRAEQREIDYQEEGRYVAT